MSTTEKFITDCRRERERYPLLPVTVKPMMRPTIKTQHVLPPIPVRDHDWIAYDDSTYDGTHESPLGIGATEAEAVADLLEQLS